MVSNSIKLHRTNVWDVNRVGQNHTYTRCVYGTFGREITKYMVVYGAYIRFWPTLDANNKAEVQQLSAVSLAHAPIALNAFQTRKH